MADREPKPCIGYMTFGDPLVNGRHLGYLSEFVLGLVGWRVPRCRHPDSGPSGMSGYLVDCGNCYARVRNWILRSVSVHMVGAR